MVQKRATHFPYKEKTVMVQNKLGKRDIPGIKKKGKNEEIRVAVGPHAYLRQERRAAAFQWKHTVKKTKTKQNKTNVTPEEDYIILLIYRYG